MINFQSKNQVVLQGQEQKIDLLQLNKYIVGFQRQLLSINAKSCAIYSNDTLEFVSGFLACSTMGIAISLPPNDSQEMLDSIKVEAYIGKFSNALTQEHNANELIQTSIDTEVSIYTSGSTGSPKQIKRKLSQLLLEVDELNSIWKNNYNNKRIIFASTVSYQHIYGLLFSILWPLKTGAIIWDKILPFEESLQNLSKNLSPLVVVSSPAFLKRLSEYNYSSQPNMSLFCSGGELTSNQHAKAEKIVNNKIKQVYGSSETGGIAFKQLGDSWQFFPSVKHKVNNAILFVKSPFCYTSEWQNTNDRVEFNNSGFTLLGRSDRIVNIEEKRVSLIQVEKAISQFPDVTDVHVISLNEKRQYLAAVIVMKSQLNKIVAKQQLKAYLKDKVERLAIPRKIRFVDQIPTNSQGKILYNTIKSLFEN